MLGGSSRIMEFPGIASARQFSTFNAPLCSPMLPRCWDRRGQVYEILAAGKDLNRRPLGGKPNDVVSHQESLPTGPSALSENLVHLIPHVLTT
jgi:hypothetical protein